MLKKQNCKMETSNFTFNQQQIDLLIQILEPMAKNEGTTYSKSTHLIANQILTKLIYTD